jgi:hypothetical protein
MWSADNSLIRKKKASDVKMDDHTTKAKYSSRVERVHTSASDIRNRIENQNTCNHCRVYLYDVFGIYNDKGAIDRHIFRYLEEHKNGTIDNLPRMSSIHILSGFWDEHNG